MRDNILRMLILFVLAAGSAQAGQEIPPQEAPPAPEPVFVRLTLYPTASLSRYDYNNDIDLFEVRAYAEVRRESQVGDVIPEARVTVLNEILDFKEDRFEKRITVDKDDLPKDVSVSIAVPGRAVISRSFPLPTWLIIENPRPAILDPAANLAVRWRFTDCPGMVGVRIYDFRSGDTVSSLDNFPKTETIVPADKIPSSTIVRIRIVSTWISKQYLGGEEFARGSEINVIAWSQVFVRTK